MKSSLKSSHTSSQSLLSSVVVLSALGGLGGCPADEDPKDPPAEVIEATVALTPGSPAIGTTLPLDITANCDVTRLGFADGEGSFAEDEIEGLGTRTPSLRIDVSRLVTRERVLAIKDEEIVANLKVSVSCADRETVVVDGGTASFFPVTAVRSVANVSNALSSTTVVLAKPSQSSSGNTEVLLTSGGALYLSREDGTSSSRVLDVRNAHDVRDADPAYGVGDWFVRTQSTGSLLFLDDELATLTTDFPTEGTTLQMATFASKLFEVTDLTGGLGDHGIKVYETDGTVNDHTVEGAMLAKSGTPWGEGQHHLFLLGQGEDVVLLQTDPLADDGVSHMDTIELPAKYADNIGTLKFELAAPKNFGPIYIAITRGSDTTIYRATSASFGTEPFGPLEEVGTLLANSLSMVVQPTGRLLISHNDDLSVVDDGGLELLVTVPGHVVLQSDGLDDAFILRANNRAVAYSAAGERVFMFPASLSSSSASVPSFDLTSTYTEDSATIQLFENSGLEDLELDVIE